MDINNIVNSTRMRNARLLDDINNKILNRKYYKFKYLPFEGALPGLYFQQQTEDAINDIGNVAYATEKVADEALQVAQQAYNIALAALETANNALAAAQTAQQTANTALNTANNALSVGTAAATAAAVAQNRADEAYDLADAAQKAADAAQNTADAAQEAANNAANDATNALTKAEDALTKIEQLSVLNYYNNLTEATDVNTLVDIHLWYLQASNNPNAPETNPGFLNVDNDHNDSVCKQLWVSETTGAIYNRFGQIVKNSDPATVSSWSEWYKMATKADIDGTTTALTERINTVANNLATHEADFSNPHKVTAAQLGLATVYKYKGSVETYADLPTSNQQIGDVYNVKQADPDHNIEAGDNVAWDGTAWDILAGDTDLSGYAQLNSANTFTATNTFTQDIIVSKGTAAGSSSTIQLGIKPSSATTQAEIGTDVNGAVIFNATENQGYAFRIGSQVNRLYLTPHKDGIALKHISTNFATYDTTNGAQWLGNANTATKLATARTINGVAFDGTKDITIADIDGTTTALTERINTVANNLATHEADFSNPHKVTAAQLGLATVYKYKGSVETYADLPTSNQQIGDVYNVKQADPDHNIEAGDNVAWDGTAWDILAGDTDLSGYAQLNSANTFTATNTFTQDIIVSKGTAAGSSSTIQLGIKPSSATTQAEIGTDVNGAVIFNATENQGYAFRIGSQVNRLYLTPHKDGIALKHISTNFATYDTTNGAQWLGNANTATKLATARTINGVAFDGTKDITIEAGGGGGDVTAAGDNNFTGTNTFNKPITVRDGALAGIGGTITLGTKPNSATTQAKINSAATGAMYYTATEGLAHFFNVGTAEVATIGGTATTATLDFLANSILKYSTSSGLRVGGGGTSKSIGFYPEAADNTAGMRLSNQAEAISTDYSIFSLQNNSAISYTKNAALQVGNFKILEVDRNNNNVTIKADSNGQILFTPNNLASNTSSIDSNGNFYISQGLTVGSTLNTGTSNGVIRAGNSENCLYFCGTAENTYYSIPNTGDVILYQSSANCYIINCTINNPSRLTINVESMNFKATVGSVPYMCKTLTFFLLVGATVPAVTWTFPTGSAVYYPKGVAPTLTANANNIINVIAVVDGTGGSLNQVCDTVVLPYSG